MPDVKRVEEAQRRFGDRFDGMALTYVENLHWPVWHHPLSYTTYESVELDALEEGLLLLVRAGVSRITNIALLLGCSVGYVSEMVSRLASVSERVGCIAQDGDEGVTALPGITTVLEKRERKVPVQRMLILARDALFGNWLSYGDTRFEAISHPDPEDGDFRWLAPEISSEVSEQDVVGFAISQLTEPEIISTEFSSMGMLEWVTLCLGCFQPTTGARGRFLLFNPAMEDAPLLELTSAFEQDLGRRKIRLYFTDGPFRAAELFWDGLAERISCDRKREEIEVQKLYLADAEKREQKLLLESVEDNTKEQQAEHAIQAPEDRDLANALREAEEARARIDELEQQLSSTPRIDYLEASQHPSVLREAIRNSQFLLILICPWIRTRVLQPLLTDLDAAIQRGVQVLVGYGMPKNPNHPDNSDEDALAELRKRQAGKRLWLVHLNTHEKVIIQDDTLFVNSSFNFLSYTGRDGRRESGTVQRGGVSFIRNRFLNAFPSHIREYVQQQLGHRG